MTRRDSALHLLSREELIVTGPVDHADWNYWPLIGFISRQRFLLICSMLPLERVDRLLEVGYGSGVFLPELAQHCHSLHGVDIHDYAGEVAHILADQGIEADLRRASCTALPFESASIDVVVAVSALEFIDDLAAACLEIARVLRRNGLLIAVTPGCNTVLDAGLRLLVHTSAKNDFGDRRRYVVPTLLNHFAIDEEHFFPPTALGCRLPVYAYRGLRLRVG